MKVLAISVHPDDETLGCGGSLLRHAAEGAELYWLIVTQTHPPEWSEEIIAEKSKEVELVSEAYGMDKVYKLGFPTVRLDTLPQEKLIYAIREVVDDVRPQTVYVVHDGDVHTDHHATFQATLSVLKSFYMHKLGVNRILSYETLSSTEAAPPQIHRAFVPNVFQDIVPYLDRKVEIMNLFSTEIQPYPFAREETAIRALARFRGATIGVDYAEAFVLIREVF